MQSSQTLPFKRGRDGTQGRPCTFPTRRHIDRCLVAPDARACTYSERETPPGTVPTRRRGTEDNSGHEAKKKLFSCFKILKILQDFPSHRIFRRVYRALNIGKK
jgi:hypothetical protein